jgi:nicotinamidase-related amidase
VERKSIARARKKSAFLVIDMLNDFVLKESPLEVPDTRKILPLLKQKLVRARKKGIPIIYLCDAHDKNDREFERMNWPPHGVKGSRGAEVVKELSPLPGDTIVNKKSYSGFYRTALNRVLKRLSVEEVILTGCVTNICILYIAYEAVVRGYDVTVLKDCVAGLDRYDHNFSLRQMEKVLGVEVV